MMTTIAMMVIAKPFLVLRNGTLSVIRVQRPACAGEAVAEAKTFFVSSTDLYTVGAAMALRMWLIALGDIGTGTAW